MSIPKIPTRNVRIEDHLPRIAEAINGLIDGKLAVTGTCTLTAGATTTTVSDTAFESGMVPLLIPTTANAAAALTNVSISARAKGSFTLTHANTGTTDRTFLYVRLG